MIPFLSGVCATVSDETLITFGRLYAAAILNFLSIEDDLRKARSLVAVSVAKTELSHAKFTQFCLSSAGGDDDVVARDAASLALAYGKAEVERLRGAAKVEAAEKSCADAKLKIDQTLKQLLDAIKIADGQGNVT